MRTKPASAAPIEGMRQRQAAGSQRVLLADQYFCSVDFELFFSEYGSPMAMPNTLMPNSFVYLVGR